MYTRMELMNCSAGLLPKHDLAQLGLHNAIQMYRMIGIADGDKMRHYRRALERPHTTLVSAEAIAKLSRGRDRMHTMENNDKHSRPSNV